MNPLIPFRRNNVVDVKPNVEKHRITTLIAASAVFRGDMDLKESIHINGVVVGNIRVDGEGMIVSVREGARIEGNVDVDIIALAGTIIGNITAKTVKLHPTARVDGEIIYERILVGDGATINSTRVASSRDLVVDANEHGALVVPLNPPAPPLSQV